MKLSSTNRNRPSREASAQSSRPATRGFLLRTVPNNGPASLRQGFAGAPWRLPSGQLLVEYALTACFNGPALLARFPYVAPESAAAVVSEEPDGRMLKSLENLSAALRVVAEGPAAALESPKEKKDPDRRGRRKPAGKQAGGTW